MRSVYPAFWWKLGDDVAAEPYWQGQPTIYLTFDDGPIPDVTDFVLETLDRWAAQATFFCIGDNVRKHRDVLYHVIEAGHSVGNHTFNHLNGWHTDDDAYMANIERCQDELRIDTNLFRPPYGRIRKSQAARLDDRYAVVMWDVLTGDFDPKLAPDTCLRKTIQYTEPGSIVVFHDSLKAFQTMRYVLPRMLNYFGERGYAFRALPQPAYA